MAYIRESRLNKCLMEGKSREKKVMEILSSTYGGVCQKSTPNEDRLKHVDFWWTTNKGTVLGIDSKSIDDKGNYWAEAQNVAGGKGSIYGESDYMAYISNEKLLLVKTAHLVNLYENKVKHKDYVTSRPEECYIPYKRSNWFCKYFDDGRKNNDIIFKIKEEDLLSYDDSILIKVG